MKEECAFCGMSGQRKVSGAFIVMFVQDYVPSLSFGYFLKWARYVAALTQSLTFLSLYIWFKS